MGGNMSSRNDILGLNKLYVDRVWLKAYPEFFAHLRLGDNWHTYQRYREEGIFQQMTDNFFRVYRTINGLKIAFKKDIEVSSVEDLKQLLRFGEKEEGSFEDFRFLSDGIIEVGKLKLAKSQILSSRWVEYTRVDERKGTVQREKMFFMELAPWMRIGVKPFVSGFIPPMIRFFLNGIIYAKEGVKFNSSGYEFHNENWIDPYNPDFNFALFMGMQEYFLKFIKENIPRIARDMWVAFFDREEDLEVKVTQVELSHDSYIEKMRLVNALRLIAGSHKTMKYDVTQRKEEIFETWGNDIGIKYYVTVKRGLQLKAYSKAIHKASGKILNRFEITLGLNKSIYEIEDRFFDQKIVELVKGIVQRVNMGLADTKTIEEIRAVLRQFVKAKKPEYKPLHEAFLLDLFIHGQVKGKGIYREIARIYAKHGLIEIQGRGRNSVYVLKPEFLQFHENLKKVFGEIPSKLLAVAEHPQRLPQ
jgi:hypothetical protein